MKPIAYAIALFCLIIGLMTAKWWLIPVILAAWIWTVRQIRIDQGYLYQLMEKRK